MIPVVLTGDGAPRLSRADRIGGQLALGMLRTYDAPVGMDMTSEQAIERAARYEWALARLSERARSRGIPEPNAKEISRYLAPYAARCCGGDIEEMVRRAARSGASREDLTRAAARRSDYVELQRVISKEIPAPRAEQITAEIKRAPEIYRRGAASRPTRLYMCMDRSCGAAVIAALSAGSGDAQILALLRARDPRNGIVPRSPVGPGSDIRLWRAVQGLRAGTWPDAPVATGLAPWVVPVPLGPLAPGPPTSARAQRAQAETALRNIAAAESLSAEITKLAAQPG